jgi:hypothetical protein
MAHENPTITYLPANKPYPNELDQNGDWHRLLVTTHVRQVAEIHVDEAFSDENKIRRAMPAYTIPGRVFPDGRIIIAQQIPDRMIRQQIRRRYVFEPGQEYEVPAVWMPALRRERCVEDVCLQHPFDCRDPTHGREVVGGLAPHLRIVGEVDAPRMHPALEDQTAPVVQPRLTNAINPPPVLSPDDRALERARARRQGAA